MISVNKLLDMIATEAVEDGGTSEAELREHGLAVMEKPAPAVKVPPIRYDLELIRGKDGRLYWVE